MVVPVGRFRLRHGPESIAERDTKTSVNLTDTPQPRRPRPMVPRAEEGTASLACHRIVHAAVAVIVWGGVGADAGRYAPGARYWTWPALRRASSVSSTDMRTVVSIELSAPPLPIARATAAIDTLSGAS